MPPIQSPPGRGGQKILVPERPVLAEKRVRFVGEEIALVIAETAGQARDAADLIEVDYEDLPMVIGVKRAIEPDAAAIHDDIPGNVCGDFEYGDGKKTAALIENATHVVGVTVESPRVAPACLNAVLQALRSAGVAHFDMPATPTRIWSALQAAKQGA